MHAAAGFQEQEGEQENCQGREAGHPGDVCKEAELYVLAAATVLLVVFLLFTFH